MHNPSCPKCGREAPPEAACPGCGYATGNGASQPTRAKPPAPPEVASWVIYPTPPEMIEQLRETFDESEFLAQLRQAEQAGWPELKDFISEIEKEANPVAETADASAE